MNNCYHLVVRASVIERTDLINIYIVVVLDYFYKISTPIPNIYNFRTDMQQTPKIFFDHDC